MATPALQLKKNIPTVVIVGRTNVGKSTLFNRLIEEQKAIVSKEAGTTRTRNEGDVVWRGKTFRLVDTGGLAFPHAVPLQEDIVHQSEQALQEADMILFVVDVQTGIAREERDLSKRLRRMKRRVPILLVGNKADNARAEALAHEMSWRGLGVGDAFPVSAANGRRTGDLLDEIHRALEKIKRRPINPAEEQAVIRVAIIGKPNVGKSSLFNALIGEKKVIVSPMPHTTREPHDTPVSYADRAIVFIDTAGIRRKARVSGALERMGIEKSIAAIERSDIVLLVLDATEPISSQDMQLGGLLERQSKSVLIILNKWDLSDDKNDRHRNEVKKKIYAHFPHLSFAPIILVSGKTGYCVHDIFPDIIRAWESRHTGIPQGALDIFLSGVLKAHSPARGKGTRRPEILGFRQVRVNPPIFELFIKHKTSLHLSYVHFIENKLRESFNFFATPLVIKLTKMKK